MATRLMGVLAVVICSSTGVAYSSKATPAEPTRSDDSHSITVTLKNYWHESITREEALRRLAGRVLDDKRRAGITEQVPPETQHYVLLEEGVFREFADFGGSTGGRLMLLLPMERRGNQLHLIVPIYNSDHAHDGRRRQLVGTEIHVYENRAGRLFEDGQPRDTFKFETGPRQLNLDVTYMMNGGHAHGSGCCNACEWVHSALNIHCADWMCCLWHGEVCLDPFGI